MAWLDTFRGLMGDDEQSKKRVVAGLRDLHRGFLERAQWLELTAAQAPSESAETDLRHLAADHRVTADLIAAALAARKASVRSAAAVAPVSNAVNHWSRIVEDLEVFQTGRNEILEQARDLLDLDPDLTDLFDLLTRRMNEHVARLRGEIAQADPQALN